jgi:WD40 repeat protein
MYAVVDDDDHVSVYRWGTDELVQSIAVHEENRMTHGQIHVIVPSFGEAFAVNESRTKAIYSLNDGHKIANLPAARNYISSLGDEFIACVLSKDDSVHVLNWAGESVSYLLMRNVQKSKRPRHLISFSAQNTGIVYTARDGTVCLVDITTEDVTEFPITDAVDFNPATNRCIVVDGDVLGQNTGYGAFVYDLTTDERVPIQVVDPTEESVIVFMDDGSVIAEIYYGSTDVVIYGADNGEFIQTITLESRVSGDAVASPISPELLILTENGLMKINIQTDERVYLPMQNEDGRPYSLFTSQTTEGVLLL